jgi:hypothetical protein
MTESKTTQRKRARRSTAASRKLEEARRRLASQLAEEREREERIKQALREFMAAGERIAVAEEVCEEKVAVLQNRIRRLREQEREKVAGAHGQQARAALMMHEAGRTVEQVADLLALSEKKARLLIAAGRDVAGPAGPELPRQKDHASEEATVGLLPPRAGADAESGEVDDRARPGRSRESGDLRGADAHHEDSDTVLVPGVSYGGGESA